MNGLQLTNHSLFGEKGRTTSRQEGFRDLHGPTTVLVEIEAPGTIGRTLFGPDISRPLNSMKKTVTGGQFRTYHWSVLSGQKDKRS